MEGDQGRQQDCRKGRELSKRRVDRNPNAISVPLVTLAVDPQGHQKSEGALRNRRRWQRRRVEQERKEKEEKTEGRERKRKGEGEAGVV